MPKTSSSEKVVVPGKYVDPGAPKDAFMQQMCVDLGNNIRNERKKRNFTMEELVSMIDISESYLGLLERGRRTPSLECLFDFCRTFGVTPNDLLLTYDKQNGKKVVVSDASIASKNDNFDAALSLLRSFDDSELEYIVSVMINLRKMTRVKR